MLDVSARFSPFDSLIFLLVIHAIISTLFPSINRLCSIKWNHFKHIPIIIILYYILTSLRFSEKNKSSFNIVGSKPNLKIHHHHFKLVLNLKKLCC